MEKSKVFYMKQHEVFKEVSREILAPAINGFAIWVLREASRKGIQRLYFLARDGYLICRCAEIYVEKFQLPIECRYLFCSRFSLRLPMYHRDMKTALEYICRGGTEVTLDKILDRSGIGEREKRITLELLEMAGREGMPLSYPELKRIRLKLENCPFFLKAVESYSKKRLPSLLGYLEQEGMTEELPMALVDSGWTGSMQKEICRALEILGKRSRLAGYYWGLYELPERMESKDYHCYYFSPETGLRKKVYFSNSLFECIFSAPHGMTTGYEKSRGRWNPVYAKADDKRKNFLEGLESILIEYGKKQASTMENMKDFQVERNRKKTEKALRRFMGSPDLQEAQVFGKQLFSDDIFDAEDQTAARKMTEKELKANHVWHKIWKMSSMGAGYVQESPWYEGSARLYGKKAGYHIFMYHLYKYLLYLKKELDYMYKKRKTVFAKKKSLNLPDRKSSKISFGK